MRRPHFVLLLLLALSAHGQEADPAQTWVERLYPKNDRLKQLRLREIAGELGIRNGSQVADVGCGPGEISIVLSHLVGAGGKIYCEDISGDPRWGAPAAKRNIRKQKVKNVAIIRGAADNPKLPGSLDSVLIVNAYHEMTQYSSMLGRIRESLKTGGRLVIVDNAPNRTAERPRAAQADNHVLSASLAARELEEAGFRIVRREDVFIDNPDSESAHWLIAAERP